MAKQFVDPDWQEAATDNAAKGYPWAVWGFCRDRPGGLHASTATRERAERFCAELNDSRCLKRQGYMFIVAYEGQ